MRLYIPIYDYIINVHILKDVKELKEFYIKLRKKLRYTEDNEGFAQAAVLPHNRQGNEVFLLMAEDCISPKLISHEVSHIVFKIFAFHNIEEKDTEHFSLLTGFLNDKITWITKQK